MVNFAVDETSASLLPCRGQVHELMILENDLALGTQRVVGSLTTNSDVTISNNLNLDQGSIIAVEL